MSIAEKLTTIAENLPKVYDSGYSKAESDMWDGIQNFGNRTNYEYAFRYWGTEYIRPKYKVVPNSSSRNLSIFDSCRKLKKVESEHFDLSNVIPNNTASSTSSNYGIFRYCNELEEVEDIGIQAGGYYYTFAECLMLKKVAVMRCNKEGTYTAPFRSCSSLVEIAIEGEIGKNFNVSYSPDLSKESQDSIIDHLADLTGETAQTISWHSDVVNTLSDEQIARIESKNWLYE